MPDDTRSVKRRSERKPVQMAVTIVLESDEAEFLANSVDISPHGLRVQTDATLAPGQPVGLVLASDPECFIKARIVWIGKSDSDQAGQAGFEFMNLFAGPVC